MLCSPSTPRKPPAEHVAQVADHPDEQQNRPGTGTIEDYYSQSNCGTPSIWVGAAPKPLAWLAKPWNAKP
jgi:hypothetical protein